MCGQCAHRIHIESAPIVFAKWHIWLDTCSQRSQRDGKQRAGCEAVAVVVAENDNVFAVLNRVLNTCGCAVEVAYWRVRSAPVRLHEGVNGITTTDLAVVEQLHL